MQFLTFLVTVVELSNKHFCKLKKILRNFPSWQTFVFVAVYEMIGFEFCHFLPRGCNILELYSKTTSRCYFKEVTRQSHRAAISQKLLEITSRCYFIEVLEITSRCYFIEVTRSLITLLFHRSYSKSHRVAISEKFLKNLIALLFPNNQDAYCWFWILIEFKFLKFLRVFRNFKNF